MHPGDRVIADFAGRQLGLVTRSQLLAAGLSRRSIQGRLDAGRLHRVHRGIYAVGHPVLLPCARRLAAVLACGTGAVLSHSSAAAHWKLTPSATSGPVHVTRPGGHRPGPVGVCVHQTAALAAFEVLVKEGVPVTSPARTLLDLATMTQPRELERAVGEAYAQRLVRVADLKVIAASSRRGSAALRAVLVDSPSLTRSEAERRLLALTRRAGLPRPRTNVRVGGHEVDALWPDQWLIVEVDGYAFHSARAAFERDRLRDADLQAAGYRVLRITWRQLDGGSEALAARLGAALHGSHGA